MIRGRLPFNASLFLSITGYSKCLLLDVEVYLNFMFLLRICCSFIMRYIFTPLKSDMHPFLTVFSSTVHTPKQSSWSSTIKSSRSITCYERFYNYLIKQFNWRMMDFLLSLISSYALVFWHKFYNFSFFYPSIQFMATRTHLTKDWTIPYYLIYPGCLPYLSWIQ